MTAQWYYAIDDEEGGPITAQELKKLADSGKLKPTDQVWKDGMPDWVNAGTLKNLCPPQAAASSAPVEPVQERNTASVTPAGEVKREAASPADDDDELEIEAPHQRPADLHVPPTDVAMESLADDKKRRRKEKLADDDYDDAFELGEQYKKVASQASKDAVSAFKTMLKNPVGGLAEAFAQLGSTQAIAVGVVFMVIFSACFFVGMNFLKPAITGTLLGTFGASGFVAFIKIGILSVLAPLGMLAGCAASRALFKGQGGFPSDVFLAGAALLPLAAFILVDGLLSTQMGELAGIAMIFAACTTVLMLYSGSTRIHTTPENVATVAVPIMILLSLWIPRIVAGIMF